MKKYFKNNIKQLIFLLLLVMASGPFFSVVIGIFSNYLNSGLGDWLSFYGSVAGIVISLIVVHLQLSLEEEKELRKYRPELVLSNDYQLIKPNCRVYFDDKYWFHLRKSENNKQYVATNSFEESYSNEDKRDKILSLEIVNNQPIFNVRILFGESLDGELIPKLNAEQRLYVISKAHQKEIHQHILGNKPNFNHVPETITLFFTTLSGEVCKYIYNVDGKGYCSINQKYFGVDYPEATKNIHICDYIVSK